MAEERILAGRDQLRTEGERENEIQRSGKAFTWTAPPCCATICQQPVLFFCLLSLIFCPVRLTRAVEVYLFFLKNCSNTCWLGTVIFIKGQPALVVTTLHCIQLLQLHVPQPFPHQPHLTLNACGPRCCWRRIIRKNTISQETSRQRTKSRERGKA